VSQEYESLAAYLERTNPTIEPILAALRYQAVCYRTRRTVEVTTRKYRARRRRKKR
jgi:hypothetical protein